MFPKEETCSQTVNPNCQPVILSFTEKLLYGPLVIGEMLVTEKS